MYTYVSRSPELSSYTIAAELINIKTHEVLGFLSNQLISTVIVSIFSVGTLLNWSIHIFDKLHLHLQIAINQFFFISISLFVPLAVP